MLTIYRAAGGFSKISDCWRREHEVKRPRENSKSSSRSVSIALLARLARSSSFLNPAATGVCFRLPHDAELQNASDLGQQRACAAQFALSSRNFPGENKIGET